MGSDDKQAGAMLIAMIISTMCVASLAPNIRYWAIVAIHK